MFNNSSFVSIFHDELNYNKGIVCCCPKGKVFLNMLLKKMTRLFGFIIGAPFVLFLLYNISQKFPLNLNEYFLNVSEFLKLLFILIFILGYFVSIKKEIIGGVMTFLSPISYITLESINAGTIRLTSITIIMVVAGTFLLFTAEKER